MCERNKKTPANLTVSTIANAAAAEYAILARIEFRRWVQISAHVSGNATIAPNPASPLTSETTGHELHSKYAN